MRGAGWLRPLARYGWLRLYTEAKLEERMVVGFLKSDPTRFVKEKPHGRGNGSNGVAGALKPIPVLLS